MNGRTIIISLGASPSLLLTRCTYVSVNSWGLRGSRPGGASPWVRSRSNIHPGSYGRWLRPFRCHTGGSWGCQGGTVHRTRSWSGYPKGKHAFMCIYYHWRWMKCKIAVIQKCQEILQYDSYWRFKETLTLMAVEPLTIHMTRGLG